MMGGNPRPRRDIGWYKSSIHEVHSVRVNKSEQQHGAGVVDHLVQEAETPDEAEPEQVRAQDEQQRDKEGAEGRAGHDGRGSAVRNVVKVREGHVETSPLLGGHFEAL